MSDGSLHFQSSSVHGQVALAEEAGSPLGGDIGDWSVTEDGAWLGNVLQEWSTFEASNFEM
jgi:hypothetical protein